MIRWILYINGALAVWVLIDGRKRKAHALPWAAVMLALPITHKLVIRRLAVPEGKAFTHQL